MTQKIDISKFDAAFKKEVFDYHSDLHKNDRGIGGSIHKRVRERFNLTSDEVVAIIEENRAVNNNTMQQGKPVNTTPAMEEVKHGTWEVHKQRKSGIGNTGYGYAVLKVLVTSEGEYKGQRGGYEVIVHQNAGLSKANAEMICEAVDNYSSMKEEYRINKRSLDNLISKHETALEENKQLKDMCRKQQKELSVCYGFIEGKVTDDAGIHLGNTTGFIMRKSSLLKRIEDLFEKAKSLNL